MCYWLINENSKLVSKTSYEHVMRDYELKPYIEYRVDDLNKKLMKRLDYENLEVN